MADRVERMRCYALRNPDLFDPYCRGNLDLCDIDALQLHFDKHGAAEKRKAQCAANDVSCYAIRNPDLLAGFCGGDPEKCQWEALLKHWADAGMSEGRQFGCESEDIRCYVQRYPDLLSGVFCGGDVNRCHFHALWLHWHVAGQREGRIMGCATTPSPPPSIAPGANSIANPGSSYDRCRISTPGIVWLMATPAEVAPLARHLNATACEGNGLFRIYRSKDREHVLVETGRGRTHAAAAITYASTLVDPGNTRKGQIGWMNVGIAGHKTLPAGSVRGLLTVYDANMETYSSFSERPVEGVQTALGVSVTRPSEMSKIELDAVFDTEAAAFFEIGRMVAPTDLLASIKVVAIKSGAVAWPSPTDSAVEALIENAWPKLRTLSRRLAGSIRARDQGR